MRVSPVAFAALLAVPLFAVPLLAGGIPRRVDSGLVCAGVRAEGSAAVTIAIVDTGVARLRALAPVLEAPVDLVGGRRADPNGHGTAMASIARVCRLCRILPVRAVGSGGLGTSALAAAGVRAAVSRGARVVDLSATSTADDCDLDAAIAEATAAGAVVVLAAGNGGSSAPIYPAAAAPEALSVAAVGSDGGLASWSSRGEWVDLAAPGALPALDLRGRVFEGTGTSVSAAFVSGVVGLVLSANPRLDPAGVEEIMLDAGDRSGLDVRSGRLLDACAALAAARASGR